MGDDDLTRKQEKILKTQQKHPDWTNEEIADRTNTSPSYVSQVTNEYDESDLNSGGGLGILLIILVLLGVGYLVVSGGDGGSSSGLLLPMAAAYRSRR